MGEIQDDSRRKALHDADLVVKLAAFRREESVRTCDAGSLLARTGRVVNQGKDATSRWLSRNLGYYPGGSSDGGGWLMVVMVVVDDADDADDDEEGRRGGGETGETKRRPIQSRPRPRAKSGDGRDGRANDNFRLQASMG